MRLFSRLSVLVVVLTAMVGGAAPAAAQEALNTVTVAATKRVDVDADIGRATFGVRTEDTSATTATSELSSRTRDVLNALRDAGFTNTELATGNVRLERKCIRKCKDPNPRDDEPARRVMGYVGSASVTLETTQLDRLGAAVDAAVRGGADSIRNVEYDVEDRDAAVLEALRQAVILAKAKGQVIAQETGRTLGPAIVVEEGRTSAPEAFTVADDLAASTAGTAGGAPSQSIPFPVEPPTLNASARVTVTWELL